VLKQLKYELEQKQERNRSMITMIGHEIEQQKEHITSTESDIQSIDASLHLLNELCQQHPDKKVFNLKRKKERVVEMKKTVSGHVLRDDLQRVDDDDEDGADSKRNAKIAAAQKRKAAKKKKKKKSVPMVWNRALRAYVPINVDGTEMQWREH
jgi:chromosome segregation ATPase